MKDGDRVQALLEDYNSKMDAILEYVKDIPAMKTKIDNIEARVGSIDEKLAALEVIVKEHSADIAELKAAKD
ncbi:hypothetical protein HY441_00895 [Candidatus Microgenomates bacterium]|nr:hypothetical protein [Candidatus Microgenomates bacterium]